MTLTPSQRLYGIGAILLAALTICSRKFNGTGEPAFIISLAVAGVAYLLAIREFFSTPRFPKQVLLVGLVLAALWHLLFLRMPPGSDDDIHRYIWDGRVQRLGYNPYILVPSDPAVRGLHTPETRTLNNPDVPSPYPAGAQLFFRAVMAIHESSLALKVAFLVCDFVIVLVLLDVLRCGRQGEHWVLAYAWNPLLATEVAGSGHIDVVGSLLLLVSAAALGRRWRAIAAVAFGLAVAVKLLPIVLLPLYWRRVRLRDGALAALVFGLLYVPFFNHGRISTGSLGTYVQSFRFNDPVFAMLERIAAPQLVVALAVLVGLLTSIYLRSNSQAWPSDAFAWPMAAALLCAPVIYPWYLLWLLPFLRSASTVPLIIWTVSIISTYYVWHLRTLGYPWLVPGWIILLEYGFVAMAGAILELRRITRRQEPDDQPSRCTFRPGRGRSMTGDKQASIAPAPVVQTKAQTQGSISEMKGCCIVGGGPAGAMLALLLARRGVHVTLLEMHRDFDREFRGDTVHPSTLEILDQIGLAERVHELRNSKISGPTLFTTRGSFMPFDLGRLRTKYPYILMVHQRDLLALLTQEARRYPGFMLLMGANVVDLIREDGVVRGVRYQAEDGVHELRALLTVGADGRFSRVRHLAGIEPVRTSPPMDVLWFRLPHLTEDIDAPGGAFGGFARGHILGGFDRKDYWQTAFVIAKGSYQSLRAEGIEGLRRRIMAIEPRLAKHVESLKDWQQVALLSVESSRCPRWYLPGLLLIGDAAHAMSPIGGLGINYAVQDAVVAANLLAKPLLTGCVTTDQLRAIQLRRLWPVRIIQAFQTQLQKRVIATALKAEEQQGLRLPWFVRAFTRIPFLRDVPPRIMALGVVRVRIEN